MKKEEANRINTIMKNVTNIQTLLGDLLMPIDALQQKYNATKQQAVNTKINAETYLKKYGTFVLDTSVKAVKEITKNIEET